MKLLILVLLSLLYCAVTSGAPDETSLAKDLPEIPKDAQEVIEREVQDPETAKKDVQALLAQDEKKPLLAVRKRFCTIPWAWSFPLKCAHLATCHMYKKIGKKYQIVAVTVQSNRSFCCRNCNCQFWSCVFSPYFPNSFCYQRLYKCQCKCLTLPLPKGCIQ